MSDQESSEKANVIDGCQPKQASEFRKVGDPSFSLVPPQEVFVDGVIGQGHNIMMQDKPCKVVEMKTSKPGKHGHGPVKFTAIDIFTGKRYEAIQEWTHPMLTFDSDKKEYSVMAIGTDGSLSLMDEAGNVIDNISLSADNVELGLKIMEAHGKGDKEIVVSVLHAIGQSRVIGFTTKDF